MQTTDVQEPIGWYLDDYLTDKSSTTYDWAVAERWDAKGWALYPLYAAPQPSDDARDAERGLSAFNAVISYMLGDGQREDPLEFLYHWNDGNFDALRKDWPDAPMAIYYADPLADHAAIDAAMGSKGA